KGSERIDEAAALLIEHDVDDRTVLSSVSPDVLRAAGRVSSRVQLALTYPDDRLGISKRPFMRPLVPVALEALRVTLPLRLPAPLRAWPQRFSSPARRSQVPKAARPAPRRPSRRPPRRRLRRRFRLPSG